MLKKFFIFFTLFVVAISSAETKKFGEYTAKLKASRDGSVYKRGETADFVLELSKNGKPVDGVKLKWKISKDSVIPETSAEGIVKNGKFTVSGTLKEAGFLKCEMRLDLPNANQPILASAGFEPLEIRASLPPPEDFRQYWESQKKILAAIPMEAKFSSVDAGAAADKVEIFDVSAKSFKRDMRGYYARPKGAKPRSCPAIVLPHQGGVRSSYKPINWALRGFIALDFNAHGIPNGEPEDFYKKLNRGELARYRTANMHNRDEVAFRAMYMRLMRAMDFLMAQPEWDGRILVAHGASQAGAQAIVAGGLYSDKVTFVSALVPALCDHSGAVIGRACGWPRFAELKKDGSYDKLAVEQMRYIDAMNFATLIKCPATIGVGFIDTSCQPTTVYATYSNIKTPKRLLVAEETGHSAGNTLNDEAVKIILDYVKKSKSTNN